MQIPSAERRRPPQAFLSVLTVAMVLATLFTCWTPAGLFSTNLTEKLALLLTAEPGQAEGDGILSPAQRIGIVAGHWGHDPGAVCPNGVTEVEVNLRIASLAQIQLAELGYLVDLLEEFDSRLHGYQAAALISIHNDSCEYVNDQATGFKVAAAVSSHDPNRANRLTECLRDRYQRVTNLPFHAGSITPDMREYHAFEEIHPITPAAIIETGFLNLDYRILTEQPDLVARGVVEGILCFIRNENIEPTPLSTQTP
jgi:N-acetylmuramoyl-L-alanine amidase